MVGKTRRTRLFSLIVAVALVVSMIGVPAIAADNVSEAKASLATVDITQVYNEVKTDNGVHNYATDGSDVNITYEATLQMTGEMAAYLQIRQKQLLSAQFCVHVDMDMELLEFATDQVSVTFTSTFLKPMKSGNYTYVLESYDPATKVFTYEITAQKTWGSDGTFDIPMELIVYSDGENAYGAGDLPEECKDQPQMYSEFSVTDWMHEIKVTLADMKVKDSVAEAVTTNSATWKYVIAQGTVDGKFTYEKSHAISTIGDYAYANQKETLEFGNDADITEWTSNVVKVRLIRQNSAPVINPPAAPDSPYLNLEDHFAYVIGYPDGLVHPEGTITRAEVATIFFRMLTDEVRNQYWSQTNPYTDVKLTDWYNNAISTLTNLGVINGYPDGGFHPNGNITRAEFATMAVRFFIITEEYTWDEDAFSDIAGHWANEYINLAYLLEIVNGYPDGTFKPENAITRAEAMTIVNNTLRRNPCKEGLLPVDVMITWPDNMDATTWYYEEVQEATNSHEYTYETDLDGEQWTAELPVRDWAAFEKAWSDANSAANPGEVVDGH